MALEWMYSIDGVDRNELSTLYRLAPRGDKKPAVQAQLERGYLTDH